MFETIERLKDGDITVETAKAIADVGKVIVESAKVECQFLDLTGGAGTGFVNVDDKPRPALPDARPIDRLN